MRKRLFILMPILVVAFTGCNRQATPSNQPTARDYESTAQEANQLLAANQPSDEQMNTAIDQTAVIDPSLSVNDSMLAIYSISMLWGQVPPSPANTAPVNDWSGSASVNGVGRYTVVVPIDFERGLDSLIRANNPTTIAWHSTTQGDADGLATLLILRRDVQYVMEPHFVFTTGMASLDIPISRMDKFDTVVFLDNRQSLIVKSWRIVRPVCPSGTLSGEWVRLVNTGDSGTFHGTWGDGNPLAGRFWTDPDGSRHFEGAWSAGMLTVIAGEMKGTWSFMDPSMCPICGNGFGEFHGRFVETLGERRTGVLQGVFGIGPGPGQNVMPFRGIWKVNCLTTHDGVN